MSEAPHHTQAILARTERAQAEASDPNTSVWVSANAGAGKTHVLKSRVLRIMLAGTAPDRILCLTYTKAAAAEMAGRVFKDLSVWATADESKLAASLSALLGRQPTHEETKAARALFARAIETPGGLKVQTIHAFCERLLQRFPLEAGVPPGFAILDDQDGARLIREAVDGVLGEAVRAKDSALGHALGRVVAFAAGDAFDTVLRAALAQREWLDAMARHITHEAEGEAAVAKLYRRALGVRADVSPSDIETEMAGVVSDMDLARAARALGEGGKNDNKLADALRAAASATGNSARAEKLRTALLTAKDEPRADSFVSKGVQASQADVYDMLRRARDRVADLVRERQGLLVADASAALMRLAGDVMQRYTAAKQLRAALDFQDLIERTARLLADGEAAAWVLLKLDGGLDHILVDEAQDTSPLQWEVIKALAGEFFPVTGGQTKPRTVFAVGDEKQSIYSFQGAEPRMFAQSGEDFRRAAEAAQIALRKVPLTLSFRTVEPLLRAVDRVLADASRTPGLTAGNEPINHVALRLGHAGCLEVWDTEKPAETEEPDAWLPLSERPQALPATRLAERIADTIARWLREGEMLASEGRPIRAGDVLVLLRKRHPFAAPMVAALKARNIPVAGADRLKITEQLAVQDLMVLGDFLTLPEDDLALATVLKSPLFGLNDDDLMRLAVDRKGATLWSRLLAAAKTDARFGPAAETLLKWRGIADQSPPFEFYAHVLDRDGGRKRLIGRLGPEAVETLTEFLNLAIEFDEAETPSLSGFLQWLRAGSREVKRDMEHGRDEVRVLTVHGAKGLEAPIVFLPDTCSAPGGAQQGKLVALEGSGLARANGRPVAWPVKGTSAVEAVRVAKEGQKTAEQEESNRLLYVALTRARDQVYVAGFEGKNGRPRDCWYDIVEAGLAGDLVSVTCADGHRVRRIATPQTVEPVAPKYLAAAAVPAAVPPAWTRTPAPREPQLALPLAPSRIAPYDVDETGDPVALQAAPGATPEEPAAPSPLQVAGSNRFQRGLLTHALLEHLPTIPGERRQAAAEAFVASRGHMLPARVRASIVTEVLTLIAEPSFAAAFGPDSRAEVPIVAEIPEPGGRGRPLRLNAVIDRLVVGDHDVLIIDYKTNRPPPSDPASVASAYLVQLAAYRLALRRIMPERPIRAAILWTDGGRLMEIPEVLLDAAERDLWQLAKARLDAP
jgi:ATP-dependent helicase/nuclease subunit A